MKTVVRLYGLELVLKKDADVGPLVKLLQGAIRVEQDYERSLSEGGEDEYFIEEPLTIRIEQVRDGAFKKRPGKVVVTDLFSPKALSGARALRVLGNGGAS